MAEIDLFAGKPRVLKKIHQKDVFPLSLQYFCVAWNVYDLFKTKEQWTQNILLQL